MGKSRQFQLFYCISEHKEQLCREWFTLNVQAFLLKQMMIPCIKYANDNSNGRFYSSAYSPSVLFAFMANVDVWL